MMTARENMTTKMIRLVCYGYLTSLRVAEVTRRWIPLVFLCAHEVSAYRLMTRNKR